MFSENIKSTNSFVLIPVLVLIFCTCVASDKDSTDYAEARRDMVEQQIQARGIKNPRLVNALLKVERHLFVPEKYRDEAYNDYPLPIGKDQTISQPYIVALMTDLLNLDGSEKVLEIGTGSGYQAAVLGELAREVYTIEIVESLAERAGQLLDSLGYDNITCREGDGYIGWEEKAPFDAIIVTCAPPFVPQPLIDQLAEDGRLVIPVGSLYQELYLIQKEDQTLTHTSIIPVRFVPMTGEGLKKER